MTTRHRRACKWRALRLEAMEPRLFLSANPLASLKTNESVDSYSSYGSQAAAESASLIGLDRVRAEYGFNGSGQTVAVIDSGIAYDHSAFGNGSAGGNRVVGGYDFAEADNNPYDDGPMGSHGTHVAGILAGDDSRITGVASGADIVALRVFDDQGNAKFTWVEEALQWVHAHRNSFANPITTVNLSIGASINADSLPLWATLEDEFAQLEADGIFISVAAGNSFATYHTTGLTYPAVSPHVVPVASVDASGNLSYFSQRDDRVIAAPGRSILSSVPDYMGNRNGVADDYAAYSGTSMAAPVVAGASMLLRQAYAVVGIADVSEQMLYSTLIATADVVYDSVTATAYHRLNIDRAIDSIMVADDFGSTSATACDLGTVASTLSVSGEIGQITDQDWFSFKAASSGKVTLSANASGSLVPTWEFASTPTDLVYNGSSVSFAVVAGQTYSVGLASGNGLGRYTLDLRLEATHAAEPVTQVGGEVQVSGTTGDDSFTLAIAANIYQLTVNGVNYQFDRGAVNSFVFDGGAGRDTILLTAGTGNTVVLQPGVVDLAGSGYKVHAVNMENATVRANSGTNRTTLYDSQGNDTLVATPSYAELSGSGFVNRVEGFSSVSAVASGGVDIARLYDSVGNDTLAVAATETTLSGRGYSNRARYFDEVYANGDAGGYDTAVLYGLDSNTQLTAEGKKATVTFVASAQTTKTNLASFDYVRALCADGKLGRRQVAAIDFVLELTGLRT